MMKWLLATALMMPLTAAADPADPNPGDANVLRECLTFKAAAQQTTCVQVIAKRCTEEAGNEYDSTIRDCYRRGETAWDEILNAEYKTLGEKLSAAQKSKLREEQRAWIKKRDKTCNAIWDEFQGTMAHPLMARCFNRETALRAIYLINYKPK